MTSTMAVIRNLGRLRLGGRHSGLIRLLPAAVTHGGPTSPSKRDYSSLLRPTPLTRDFLLPTPRRECSAPPVRSLSLEAAQQSVQLFYFGCLKSVPVTFVMEQLCAFHDSTGLPWWAVVAMTTVTLRGLLVFPASVTSQKTIANRARVFLTMDLRYIPGLREAANEQVRLNGWSEHKAKWYFENSRLKLQNDLIIKHNCAASKIYSPLFLQIPLWVCTTMAIRRMCSTALPWDLQAPTRLMEFSTEGLLWVPNLCVPDTTLILPMVVGLTFLFNCEVHRLAQSDSDRLSAEKVQKQRNKWLTRILRGLAITMIPIASVVPSAVALYWAISGFCGIAVNLALKSPKVRRAVRIPEALGHPATPYTNIATNLKNIILRRRRGDGGLSS